MTQSDYASAFEQLTDNPPFPWQWDLYDKWFRHGKFPSSCNLPTGLGKTSVVAIWLIALANHPDKLPRRLVYVVNRRTVVDQTTNEVEKLRANLPKLNSGTGTLALSTLRGQFADNREWSADPSRPAVICGTVDMIGSRLLFSGYGVGMKGRPLHAGFLGQDALLIHDEAHLEPAFQDLIKAIECEQKRCKEFRSFRVMELTATTRGKGEVFELTPEEKAIPAELPAKPTEPKHYVWQRMKSKKALKFHPVRRDSVPTRIGELARDQWKNSRKAILIFVRTIDDVKTVKAVLTDKKKGGVAEDQVRSLTGTMRGKERDDLATTDAVFAKFSPAPKVAEKEGTVYLICTSAGEVGVDISADHMVCDLSTLDSMAQRFGRVNRRGEGAAMIDVVYETDPNPKPPSPAFEAARWKSKQALERLAACDWTENRLDASPSAIGVVMKALTEDERDAAFAPPPIILPVTDILFDTWALTTIRGTLPGRPEVEPYLHGITNDDFATEFAWREEVSLLTGKVVDNTITELLDEFPLKPHETLRVPTFGKRGSAAAHLEAIAERTPDLPAWVIEPNGKVAIYPKLAKLAKEVSQNPRSLVERTVVLPPSAGGLTPDGTLKGDLEHDPNRDDYDVAGTPPPKVEPLLRLLVTPADSGMTVGTVARITAWPVTDTIECTPGEKPLEAVNAGLIAAGRARIRTIFRIDIPAGTDHEDSSPRNYLVVREVKSATGQSPLPEWPALTEHLVGVRRFAEQIVARLTLDKKLADAVVLAATWHDLGKERAVWQRGAGNRSGFVPVAKTLHGRPPENLNHYRHELGSMVDVLTETGFADRFEALDDGQRDVVLHLIATHHGRGRPHFPEDESHDVESPAEAVAGVVSDTPRRFARLQRRFGRWGLAYLESLLRAADILESQRIEAAPLPDDWPKGPPSAKPNLQPQTPRAQADPSITVAVDLTNPGQFFACCGLLELADRLWPQTEDCQAAEGWFASGHFEISCGGTLRELLARAQQIQFAGIAEEEAEDEQEDETEEANAVVTPLEIVTPVTMRLDWWQDIKLKPWAGSMNARNIALAMCRVIDPNNSDPLNQSQVVPEVKEVAKGTKGGKPKPKEPFHFDARRGSNSLGRDVGFIHDTLKKKWKTPMFAHPVVEFFALLGLQRARPQPTDKPRVYDYFTWSSAWRCQAAVLPLAVCGLLGDPQARRYRFVNAFRTGKKRHKAYMPASPLPTGDRR